MFMKLKADAKKLSTIGTLQWKSHGQEMPPRLVHAAQAKAQMQDGEQKIVQATVQVNVRQVIIF
jgi:hypothetical protein